MPETESALPRTATRKEADAAASVRSSRGWKTALNVALLAAISATIMPLNCEYASEHWNYAFLAEAVLLCLTLTPAGLGRGRIATWAEFGRVAVVFLVPPLAVATVYARFTDKPFHGISAEIWFVQSVAQEFLFGGFVYGRLAGVFGAPEKGWRGAFSLPMLLTPLMFASWHWQNAYSFSASYFAFQMIYTALGGWWCLNLRRWTGSVWLNVALHVLVNWLASVV